MRAIGGFQIFPMIYSAAIITPSDYILRNTLSTWFMDRGDDISFSGCLNTVPRSYSIDARMDITADGSRGPVYSRLMSLFAALGGNQWRRKDNWGVGDPCFQGWYGVECDCHGNIIRLSLIDNSLQGTIPAELGQITSLSEIYLHNTVKASPGYMNPYANDIVGPMPNLGGLSSLRVLDISLNSIESLPVDIHSNTNLEVLSATGNRITSLPNGLGNLVKLRILELEDNQIAGIFPISQVCNLASLYIFNVGNNSLTGQLIDSSFCLRSLDPLIFDISGPHPSSVGSYNSLTGNVPKSLVDTWSNIGQGYLSVYQQFGLVGDVPDACMDLRFCYTSNFMAHGNLAWVAGNAGDVPQVVYDTIGLATQ